MNSGKASFTQYFVYTLPDRVIQSGKKIDRALLIRHRDAVGRESWVFEPVAQRSPGVPELRMSAMAEIAYLPDCAGVGLPIERGSIQKRPRRCRI